MGTLKPIASILPKLSEKTLRKKGYWTGMLIKNWEKIVGPEIAQHTFPLTLKFLPNKRAVLQIQVNKPALTLELQHQTVQIIEKIDSVFGEKIVEKVQFLQGCPKN